MHARVAAFENPRFDDPSLIDELSRRARESAPKWQEALKSGLGYLMLVDRESKRSLGITFFANEDDIREAEPVFERMGDEMPEEVRGKRKSVNVYEVAIFEGGHDAKAARVSKFEGDPSRIDDSIRQSRDEFLPRLKQLQGYKGALALVDRRNGKTLAITLWEGEDALRSSEQQADQVRQQFAEAESGRIVGVERYQLMYAQMPAEVAASR